MRFIERLAAGAFLPRDRRPRIGIKAIFGCSVCHAHFPRTFVLRTYSCTAAKLSPAFRAQSPVAGRCRPSGSRLSLSRSSGQGEDKSLAMAPSRLSAFVTLLRERFEDAAREGEAPVLVTWPGVRP